MQNAGTIELVGKDVEVFFGILYYMGLAKVPSEGLWENICAVLYD